jgi:2-polyprenyl-3-methyl-5-hydroxy-6-metoxy-1,4-benzoquinol methylase
VKRKGVDLDPTILVEGSGGVAFDGTKATYRNTLMEDASLADSYNFIFSSDVMEHVENLRGVCGSCYRALKKGGGRMFHRIDFSGHSELKDPVPPLGFQTYPDWLYGLMYPRASRATRSFVSDHHLALEKAGLQVGETRLTRSADPQYLENLWPQLRRQARLIPKAALGVLEAIISSHKE